MIYFRLLLILGLLSPALAAGSNATCETAKADVARQCDANDSIALLQNIFATPEIQQDAVNGFLIEVSSCAQIFHQCAIACDANTAGRSQSPAAIYALFNSDLAYGGQCRRALKKEINRFAATCSSKLGKINNPSTAIGAESRQTLAIMCTPIEDTSVYASRVNPGDDGAQICGFGTKCPSTKPGAAAGTGDSEQGRIPTPRLFGVPVTLPTASGGGGSDNPINPVSGPATEPPRDNPHTDAATAEDNTGDGAVSSFDDPEDTTGGDGSEGNEEDNSGDTGKNPLGTGVDIATSPFGAVEQTDVENLMDLANNIGAAQVPNTQNVSGKLNLPVGNYRVQPTQPTQIQAGQLGSSTSLRPRLRRPRFQGLSPEKKQQLLGANAAAGGGAPPGGGGAGGGGFGGGAGAGGGGGGRPGAAGGRRGSPYSKYADQMGGNSFYGAGKGGGSGAAGGKTDKAKKASLAQQAKTPTNLIKGVPTKAFDPRLGLRMINSQFKKGLKNYMIQVGDVKETPTIFKEINYNYTVDGNNRPRSFLNSRGQY